jgi:hypothetical protein
MVSRRLITCLCACFLLPSSANAQLQIGERLRINGYGSFEFEKRLTDEGKADPNGSFDADELDLVLNFNPVSRLRVAADLTWEHGAATEDGRGNVAVEYAFTELFVRDWLKVRAGKMFTHFGIYNEIHTAKPAFLSVKEPLSTNKNDKFGSLLRFYPRWQAGLALLGNGHLSSVDFDYVLQLSNGDQLDGNPFEEDDNTAKAVTARLRLHPTREVSVGFSFYEDQLGERDAEGEDTGRRTKLLSYGAYATWTPSALGLEFEYVRGHVDPSALQAHGRSGLTAMVYYRYRDRFTPYFRFEWLDPDSEVVDDYARQYVYGLNVRVVQGLYLKCDLNTVQAGEHNLRFRGQGFTEVKGSVAVGF